MSGYSPNVVASDGIVLRITADSTAIGSSTYTVVATAAGTTDLYAPRRPPFRHNNGNRQRSERTYVPSHVKRPRNF